MEEYLGPIVKGDEIKKVLTKRSNQYIYKTISSSKPENLKKKVELEEKDDWKRSRKNKRSTRMEKEKSSDEQLENS